MLMFICLGSDEAFTELTVLEGDAVAELLACLFARLP